MSIKKGLLLASMALALVVFVAPAAASASVWKHEGVSVTSGEESFSGQAAFSGLGSGIECEVHATIQITGATTGSVTSFVITTETCEGEGLFAECEIIQDESTTPWPVEVTETDIDITDVVIHNTFDEGCPAERLTLTVPSVTVTLDTPQAISTVTLEGEGEVVTDIGPLPAEITGTLHAAHPGTYGIG